jgi:hypothetical protein
MNGIRAEAAQRRVQGELRVLVDRDGACGSSALELSALTEAVQAHGGARR